MVLLRKTPPPLGGTPTFFAIAERVGYNAQGRPEGSDLGTIRELYALWREGKEVPHPLARTVIPPDPVDRLDAEFHVREAPSLGTGRPLGELAVLVRERVRREELEPEVAYLEISHLSPAVPLVLA